MYLNTTVKIPEIKGKIITKKKGGTTYILYQYGSEYNQDKRYAVPLRAIVGKVSPDDPGFMFPNDKFMVYFPDAEIPEELPGEALPHWELAKKYDIIDFDLGVKLTGAGFQYIRVRVHVSSAP